MFIKRFAAVGALGFFLASASVQAGEVALDASSSQALSQSAQAAIQQASADDQGMFLTAIDVISIHHAHEVMNEQYGSDVDKMDLSVLSEQDGESIISLTHQTLDGKTVSEVIDMASAEEYLEARMTVAMLAEQMRVQHEHDEANPMN